MDQELRKNLKRIANSPSYRLAETDIDFLTRPELRPVRMQLELLKPEMTLVEHEIPFHDRGLWGDTNRSLGRRE